MLNTYIQHMPTCDYIDFNILLCPSYSSYAYVCINVCTYVLICILQTKNHIHSIFITDCCLQQLSSVGFFEFKMVLSSTSYDLIPIWISFHISHLHMCAHFSPHNVIMTTETDSTQHQQWKHTSVTSFLRFSLRKCDRLVVRPPFAF